jgi:S1-C subfamily serine protease
VVVGVVTPDSGADNAGILSDDLIVGFNGTVIKSMSDLAAAVRLQPPQATVTVELVRNGENLVVDVTLGLLNEP